MGGHAHHGADMRDRASILQAVAERIGLSGQRFTGVRRDIVDALAGAARPLSIPEILELSPDLAQSSVYRNLAVLEESGAVVRVVTADEWARFELSEEITGHHHHMVCNTCGSVGDVRIPDAVERELERVLGMVASHEGFEIDHHRLDLVGVCRSCR